MTFSHRNRKSAGLLLAGPASLRADNGEVTAVSSKVSVDYIRA